MRIAALIVCALVAWVPRAQAQRVLRTSEEPASVEKDKITFFLPLPYDRMKAPETPVIGYYVWRIIVETLRPFSIVVTSDTALRTDKSRDVLRATSVRLCADPVVESARECRAPISAKMEVEFDHFRVIIRDAELVARVRRERPESYARYVVEPGGRYVLSRQLFAHQQFERP